MIDILIPTIREPEALLDVLVSLAEATVIPHVVHVIREGKSYAEAVNLVARRDCRQEFLFLGADDLKFERGWDVAALAKFADPSVHVVGTNDLHHPEHEAGTHATHYVIRRRYLDLMTGTIDRCAYVLYPYDHNYTDTEFIQTAQFRGCYAYARDSRTEHCHAVWGKNPWDDVYTKGHRRVNEDRAIFESRQPLWGRQPV